MWIYPISFHGHISGACTYSRPFMYCNVASKLEAYYISWKEIGKQNNKVCGKFSLQAMAERTSNTEEYTHQPSPTVAHGPLSDVAFLLTSKSTTYKTITQSSFHKKQNADHICMLNLYFTQPVPFLIQCMHQICFMLSADQSIDNNRQGYSSLFVLPWWNKALRRLCSQTCPDI